MSLSPSLVQSGSRWPAHEPLSFRIVKYPTTFPQQFVDAELTKALKVKWRRFRRQASFIDRFLSAVEQRLQPGVRTSEIAQA